MFSGDAGVLAGRLILMSKHVSLLRNGVKCAGFRPTTRNRFLMFRVGVDWPFVDLIGYDSVGVVFASSVRIFECRNCGSARFPIVQSN